jgi:hypothetical protein
MYTLNYKVFCALYCALHSILHSILHSYILCGTVVHGGNVAVSTGHASISNSNLARARVEKGPAACFPSRDVGSLGKNLPRSTRDCIEAAAAAGACTGCRCWCGRCWRGRGGCWGGRCRSGWYWGGRTRSLTHSLACSFIPKVAALCGRVALVALAFVLAVVRCGFARSNAPGLRRVRTATSRLWGALPHQMVARIAH